MTLGHRFKKLPERATLVAFGDCFRSNSGKWKINCHFLLPNDMVTLIDMSIEAIPFLALNRTYHNGELQKIRGWDGDTVIPDKNNITLMTMADVPKHFFKHPMTVECLSQKVFRLVNKQQNIWVPALELARFFLLKTLVNTRYAFYEGNLNAMANVDIDAGNCIIRLDSRYPKYLLDNKSHQEYLAWLILNKHVNKSFCSIFANYMKSGVSKQWTFNFDPFELQDTRIKWRGSMIRGEYFVNEIISASNIKSRIPYETILFSHPKDVERQKSTKPGCGGEGATDVSEVFYEIEDREPPSSLSEHRIISMPKGIISFEQQLDTERLISKKSSLAGKFKGEDNGSAVSVGITEVDRPGIGVPCDVDSIKEPAEVKNNFKEIEAAIKHIESIKAEWKFDSEVIDLPTPSQEKNKKMSYRFVIIGLQRRKNFLTKIELSSTDIVFLLEIDTSDNRKLSTLIVRLKNDKGGVKPIKKILEDLVINSGCWNRITINTETESRSFLNHPNKEALKNNPEEATAAWAERIINAICPQS